jgi:hypothetical protein
MSKEKVTLSRGTPPADVVEERDRLTRAISGNKGATIKPEQPKEAASEVAELNTETNLKRHFVPVPEPQIIGTLQLESEHLDLQIDYIDFEENDFSVLFVLPNTAKLNAKLKRAENFIVNCPHVSRQQVTYIGPPTMFKRTGIHLFFLLKSEDTDS